MLEQFTYMGYYWQIEQEEILRGAEHRRLVAEAKAASRQVRPQNSKTIKMWFMKEK